MLTPDFYLPPASPNEVLGTLERIYNDARDERGTNVAYNSHLGQAVLKMVGGCNYECSSPDPGFGYDCYEYVTDDWLRMPPVMTDEVAWQAGVALGRYVAHNNLTQMEGTIHGGEPLYVPRDPARPEQRTAQYYDRILPLMREAMASVAPDAALNFSMQTNGSLLTAQNLDMLKRHGVKTKVSLDGPAAVHDLNRVIMHKGRRIGTHRLVERGLQRLSSEAYADIYAGLICVIDLRADPEEVLAELCRYSPPEVKLHLPYGTWDDLPPGLRDDPLRRREVIQTLAIYRANERKRVISPRQVTEALADHPNQELRDAAPEAEKLYRHTRSFDQEEVMSVLPYADWLLKLYRANKQLETPLNIRYFRSVEQMVLGGPSLTEAIGPNTGSEVVVRTDGSIELPDSLRMARSGIEKTGYNIFDHSLEEVAGDLRLHHHLGRKSVAAACAGCDLQQICGGGHIANRFSQDRGLDNPSVYCPDLEAMIRAIRDAVLDPQLKVVKGILDDRRYKETAAFNEARRAAPFFVPSDLEL